MTKPKVIFFGNGPLADFAKTALEKSCDIIFHAREKADLESVKKIKAKKQISVSFLACFKKTAYFCTAKTVE